MTAQLNHTIVPAIDKHASAEFLGHILGIDAGRAWGPFVVLALANGVSLDFVDAAAVEEHHYAFLVEEGDFDTTFERIRATGTSYYADPFRRRPGEVNHRYGGRGVYFDDPDHHLMEVITRPYGATPAG
jgi:extradiol dioxygenase family protein